MDLKHLIGSKVLVGALVLSFAATAVWAGDTEVTSPGAGTTAVTRTAENGDTSLMTYQVARDSNDSVKFENAALSLGEDGAIESDLFVINVKDAGDTVRVQTKAGKDTAEWISGESDFQVDANGFHVELVSVSGNTYTLRLTSTTEVVEGLSNVTFTFYPGQLADASYD